MCHLIFHIHPYSPIFTHVATSLELRTSGSMRSREGETPWGWKWDDRWHGRGQEKSESEEWIDVKVEDEDGWESWSNSRSWERSSQSRQNKYLEKSKGSPEHLQSLCTELTQELGDTTDTPRLQSFQRRLLREAVQYNCWRIRDLDPSVCYLAEWHYGHLIQRIPLHDQRLRGGHAEISATFRHGPHKGQLVQTLINDLSTGKCKANLLAPLVAVKFAGFLLVVCGNRRWYAVRNPVGGNFELETNHSRHILMSHFRLNRPCSKTVEFNI